MISEIQDILSKILNTTNILKMRIDVLNNMLKEETLVFENNLIFSNPATEEVFKECNCESALSIGEFLKKFNKWLVISEQVDLNDLQIIPNELLKKTLGLSGKKINYGHVLKRLFSVITSP